MEKPQRGDTETARLHRSGAPEMPLHNWLNLNEHLRQRIAAADERYAKLLELQTAARHRAPHPDWDGLRRLMRSEIMASNDYGTLRTDFSGSVQEIEIVQCKERMTSR